MDDRNDAEVARTRQLLRTALHLSGRSNRDVERALYLSCGYVSRLLAGAIELRVKHVLDIAEAVELAPGEFFQFAFPCHGELKSRPARKLLDLISRISGTKPDAPAPTPLGELTPDELEDMLRGAVRAVFAELARP